MWVGGSVSGLTPLAPPLLGAVDVVLELNADLPLVGLVPDVGVLQQLLRGRPLGVVFHQACLDEADELLGPGGGGGGGGSMEEVRRRLVGWWKRWKVVVERGGGGRGGTWWWRRL